MENAQDLARIVVDTLISSRRSVRAFLPTPVPRDTVDAILRLASRAPSGTNTQPWKVYVLGGERKKALSAEIRAIFDDPEQLRQHPTRVLDWPAPYLDRRRKVGKDLYRLLDIAKGDKARMHAQHARNYEFFDAPVGLIFTIDRFLDEFSYLDYGMFLQNIMLVAHARGLATCPQGAFIQFHKVIAKQLQLPDSEAVICGMALGYRDGDAPENRLQMEREVPDGFVRYLDH